MHNLHFLLVNGENAQDAASRAEAAIAHWGDDNNWRSIGGIASEDGKDDIDNHDNGRWSLSFLDEEKDAPKEGTYFSRAVAYLHSIITSAVQFRYEPYSKHEDMHSALDALRDCIQSFDVSKGSAITLWSLARNLKLLAALVESRRQLEAGKLIATLNEWEFTEMGLTDLTDYASDGKRYLVFLDMHS